MTEDSFYVGKGKPPEFLPDHIRDPKARKSFEQQGMNEMQQAVASVRQQPRMPSPQLQEDEVMYIRNNKSMSLHAHEEGFVINGQLTTDTRGPFQRMPRRDVQDSFILSRLFEGDNPPLKELSKEEYTEEYREFLDKRKEREANARRASRLEREDSEYDLQSNRIKVTRQRGG